MSFTSVAAVAVVLGLTLAGCGSSGDSAETESSASPTESSETTEASETSEAPETSAAAPAPPGQTVGEYLTANGVTQTIVKAGEPGVPTLDLPMPDGWESITGEDVPPDAYGAIYFTAAAGTPNPPAILARMARLDGGTFDVATIIELAPNAVTKLPGWQGPAAGQASELGGFEASAIAGTADVDGAPNFVARKTVVIPGPQNTYLLALDAQGPADQQQVLMDAMTVIDEGTTITP